jgi:YVTN family beta-propeller protein
VFNPTTLKQSRTIVTGSGGDGLALSPDGTKMYVTVDYLRELQVISTATGAILAAIPVPVNVSGEPPLELAISPNGAFVYVFAPQDSISSSLLMAINTTTYTVTATSNASYGGTLGPLLVSPDGTELYFEEGYANEYIQVLNAATLEPEKQISLNNAYSSDLAITSAGLILMTDSNNQLLVINPQTSSVTTFTLPGTEGYPGVVIASPDGSTAYISFALGSILAVNVSTGATVFDATTNYIPTHFAISPDGSTLYSTNLSSAQAWSLSEFSISSQEVVTTISQLGPIAGLALAENNLYVLNANESAIATVNVASETLTHVALGGVGIGPLAIPPGGVTVWASQFSSGLGGDLLLYNPATFQYKYIVDISGAIVFGPGGTVVYIYNPGAVTAYNPTTLTPIATAHAGQLTNIGQVIPSPDGTRLYISVQYVSGGPIKNSGVEFGPGGILILDTSTFEFIKDINLAYGLGAMALTPDGSTLVFTGNEGRVQLLSTSTYELTGTVQLSPTNGYLEDVALSPNGSTAYVTDATNNLLLVANLQTKTQTSTISVGSSPSPVVITPDGSEAWVSTLSGLDVVNLATGAVNSVTLPGEPGDIVFAP